MKDESRGFKMRGVEIRVVTPVSVFVIFFSGCFILSLVYLLAVNLGLIPRFSPEMISNLTDKVDSMRPLPKSLIYALLIGATGGIAATLLTLIYNIFSSIFGGVRMELKQ